MFVSYNYSSYPQDNFIKKERGNIFKGTIEELPSDNNTPLGCSPYKIDDAIIMYSPSRSTQAKAKKVWELRENIAAIIGKFTFTVGTISAIIGGMAIMEIAGAVIPGLIFLAAGVALIGIGILCFHLADKAHQNRLKWDTLEVDNRAWARRTIVGPDEMNRLKLEDKLSILSDYEGMLKLGEELQKSCEVLKDKITKNNDPNAKEEIDREIQQLNNMNQEIIDGVKKFTEKYIAYHTKHKEKIDRDFNVLLLQSIKYEKQRQDIEEAFLLKFP